ncbi:MAG: AAA family ATPase [bacterium]|nr:AAA family ATPase [bacterium]
MSANPIKKIETIKNVRSFLDFTCTGNLGKKNVIYASNGSGKTNLSRFINHVSDKNLDLQKLKSLEAGTNAIEFKISFTDTTSIDQNNYTSSNLERVLVYNSDYIENCVRSSDFSNKQIDGQLEVELGPEQAKLLDLENQLTAKNAELDVEKVNLDSLLTTKITEIKEWDPRGRLVTVELVYANLTTTKYSDYLLNKEDKNVGGSTQEGWFNAKENFDQIKDLDPETDKVQFNLNEFNVDRLDLGWTEENLTKKAEFAEPPSGEVKEHIEKITNEWIKSGLKTHEADGDHCPFCLQDLNDKGKDVIQKYKVHIESEKAKFEEKIDQEIKNITSFVTDLERIDNTTKAVFEIRVKNLNISDAWKDLDPVTLISKLEEIKVKLAEKRKYPNVENVFIDNYFIDLKNAISSVNIAIISNKAGVEHINKKLTSITNRQTDLRKLVGQKYLVEFYEANKSTIEKRDSISSSIKTIESEISDTKKTIPTKEVATKIVDLFNIFIKQIGIKKYKADILSGKIILTLDDAHNISGEVKNLLSEGEKNAIALSYFLASSIRRLTSSEKYSNGIFVIDDPICSMSYKYFYGVCDVLKSFYKTVQINALSGNELSPCPQLIIMTHNVQFYNMLTSNIFKKNTSYFELEKEGGKHLLKEVKDHKLSEYKTALRRVKRYSEDINTEENVGNDIRRVLETICNFHGYKDFNQDNISAILTGMTGSLLSFAHDSSHEDTNNYEDPFESKQYKEMATELIRLIEIYSPEVLKDL